LLKVQKRFQIVTNLTAKTSETCLFVLQRLKQRFPIFKNCGTYRKDNTIFTPSSEKNNFMWRFTCSLAACYLQQSE